MLHRNFKPAKCKTSLKLAASRLKLMKNKKEVLLKQLKRELAQLLESGQDQTARIRVENAVREENAIAGYELLEIYCEIIAARLPIIESQKNCPNDLKEAIASVIFASPRCADITEFAEIRKHFTAKYGKEFVTAAIELRPESGVSRMLVEKLSVKAPDGETKIKILSAIAEEHNIKWDPTAFGVQESKPRDDLLNAPNTFENASKSHIELPAVQTGPSRIQVPPSSDLKDKNKPASSKKHATPASNLQNFPSGDGSSGSTTTQAAANPGRTQSGSGSERMDATHSHSRDGNAYSAGSHNWNMEFKDATAAAEAAAEAAERASMAARAAAELSGRGHIMTEHSTESPGFKSQGPRRERPSESVGSKLTGKQTSTVYDKDPKIQSGHVYRNEQEGFSETFHQDSRNSIKKSSSASSRPKTGSDDNEILMNKQKGNNIYLHKRQPEVKATEVKKNRAFSEVNKTNINSKADVNLQSDDRQSDLHHEDMNHVGEERMKEKASGVTSQSHSINHDSAYGISRSSQTSSIDDSENLFRSNEQDTTHGDAVASTSYNDTAVVFDDPLSDDDDFVVDTRSGYDVVEDPSPSSNLNDVHIDAAAKTSSSSNAVAAFDESDSDDEAFGFDSDPGRDESLTESKDYLKELDMLPVNFDDLGGPSSESEDDRYLNKPSTESNSEFKFGNLRGGLRNKRSPYTIHPPIAVAAASKTLPEDSAATAKQASPSPATRAGSAKNIEVITEVEQNPTSKLTTKISDVVRADSDDLSEQTPTSPGRAGGVFSRRTKDNSGLVAHSSLNARSKTELKHNLSSPISVPGSDSDDFEEDLSEKHFNRKKQPSSVKSSQQSNPKSQSGSPLKHFDSNDGASDAVKHTSPISGRTGAAPSRRTKASPSPGTNSYSKARVSGDTESNSEQKPSGTRSSYGSVTASKAEPQKVRPARQDSSGEKSTEQATPKPIPKSGSSATEQTSSPLRAAKSGSSASPKPSSSSSSGSDPSKEGTSVGSKPSPLSSGNDPSKEGTVKKASHVHPKLPDYDSLAATLQSMRENRK